MKNIFVFSFGSLAVKLIAFFMVPLYTDVLSTYEYGTVDLASTVATIAIPVLTLNIMEAVMRFNLDKGADRDGITKIGIVVLTATIVIALSLIPMCELFQTLSGLGVYVYLYCVTNAASMVFMCDLRGKELLGQFSFGNIINAFLSAALNILFLVGLGLGIKGFFWAYIISNFVTAVYALIIGKGYRAVFAKFDRAKMKEMVKYSALLIPNSSMWWIMTSSDHFFVSSMIGVSENAIYAVSYKLPSIITVVMVIFNQAWGYSAIREKESKDSEEYTNRVFKALTAVTMIVGVGLMAITKRFLSIYVQADYYSAWEYTPFLNVGCVFMTLGTFVGESYNVYKDSKGMLLSGSFGAVLNIILNFILIPIIGVSGAAIATCISYISVFIFRAVNTRKYTKYKIFSKELISGTVALLISGGLTFGEGIIFQILQWLILAVLLVIYKKYWIELAKRLLAIIKKKKQ